MPRPKKYFTEEEVKDGKRQTDKNYYQKRKLDENGEEINYKEYLEKTGKKQLKLTLTTEEDEAIRAYCNENNLKPQEYIKGLIRQALKLEEE